MEKKYKYLALWISLLIPLTLLAFYKPYFQYFPSFGEIKPTVHFHAFVASVWIGMLILQPILIQRKKIESHRLLGKISYFWFPALIGSFIPLMMDVAASEYPKVLFFSIADVCLLLLFFTLAINNRKNTPLHMRYMVLTAMVFLGPTVGRIGGIWFNQPPLISQGIQYSLIALILVFLIKGDQNKERSAKPYYLGSFAYLIHALFFYAIFI